MVVKRFILTIAVTDADAKRFNEKLVEDSCLHGLMIEDGMGAASITSADERTVGIADPLDKDEAYDRWIAMCETEAYK